MNIKSSIFARGNTLEKRQARTGYLFILPFIVGVVFVFGPNIIQSFLFSMNDIVVGNQGFTLKGVGFTYYWKALTVNPDYNRLLVTTIKDIIAEVPVVIIFSIFIASILNQKFKGRVLARVVFFIPVLLATGIIARIEQDTNLMNFTENIRSLDTGMSVDGLQFLQVTAFLKKLDFSPALINIVIQASDRIYQVVSSSGIQIFIFLAALQEIPESMYEAAQVEGCSGWEIFWKITFPMVSPLIIVNAVYTVIDIFTKPTNQLLRFMEWLSFGQNQFGLSSAMAWIYFAAVALILAVAGFIASRFVFYND